MFDIGFSELIVIAVVALVVIGPERLPKVARTIGHLLGKAQRYVNDVKTEINREMEIDELRRLQAEMQDAARKLETNVHQTMRETEDSVQQSVKSIEDDVAALEAMPPASAQAVTSAPGQPSAQPSLAQSSVTPLPHKPAAATEMQGPPVAAGASAAGVGAAGAGQLAAEESIKLDPTDYNPAEKDGPILLSDAYPEPEPEKKSEPPRTAVQSASQESTPAGLQKS
ncbi:MAG: Sec-independent protein translocase protein TatB [Limnobacter sp.]|nr:Sec-independent protein translocase protein TatB [Limnobacter sp.]